MNSIQQQSALALLALCCIAPAASSQDEDFYDTSVLRTIELTFEQSNYWQQLENNYASETYLAADLTIEGEVLEDVGVRFKGNSSYNSIGNSQKKPFNIDLNVFADSLGADHDFQGYKKIILNNGFKDPSFVREVLTWEICREFVPAPRSNWVKLVINGESWGVYMNCEHLDDEMLSRWFAEEDGNRYKAEGGPGAGPSNLTWLGSDPALYEGQFQLKNPDDAVNPHDDIVELCDVLNNSPGGTTFDAVQDVLDVDGSLWMLALDNVFVNLDSYYGGGHNYYLFHDFEHDRMETLMWDVNESFGVFLGGLPPGIPPHELPLDYRVGDPGRPLVSELVGDSVGWDDFVHHVDRILGEFDWSLVGPRGVAYQDLIRAEVYADTKKLYSNSDFDQNLTQDVTTGGGGGPPGGQNFPGIQPFIESRRAYLLAQPELSSARPLIADTSVVPSSPTELDDILFLATDASGVNIANYELRWRVQGAYQGVSMFDDGLHGDGAAGDGVWGVTISAQPGGALVEYVVRAEATGGTGGAVSFDPENGESAPSSVFVQALGSQSLFINEFIADNEAGITDEMDQTEDWVELYNPSGSAVDLTGYHLTDDLSNSTKWAFPSVSIPAGGYLLVWCDDDEADGPLHATFKLDNDGEAIGLYGPVVSGTPLIDSYSFAAQSDDVSEGRETDGAEDWVFFTTPTPGASNGSSGVGTSYCFGDGSGAACPCTNAGGPDEGCATSNGTGAILAGSGTVSVATGDFVLSGSQLVAGQPGLYFQGNNAVAGGTGSAFGDGLRCAGGGVIRLQVRSASSSGESATTIDLASKGGVSAGDLRRYQLWFRDPGSGSPCGNGFNLSNGLEITWAP